jgi:hypothetical protein
VIAATAAHPQTQRRNFATFDIHARRLRVGHGIQFEVITKQTNNGIFYAANQLSHTQTTPPQIQQTVHNYLAGPMIRNLPASVGLYDGDSPSIKYVLRLTRLPLRKNSLMLEQP